MRVLILGSDSPLGRALTDFLEDLGRHELVCLTRSASRWKSERQAKKAVRKAGADAVVDIRVEAVADGGQEIAELDVHVEAEIEEEEEEGKPGIETKTQESFKIQTLAPGAQILGLADSKLLKRAIIEIK